MKLSLVRKGIFGKRYLKLPKQFLENHKCKSGAATPIYGECNDDVIIISTSEKELVRKNVYVEGMLDESDEVPDCLIKLSENVETVPYKDVTGFFNFRGEVYYKAKGSAGKLISDDETSFSNSVKQRFPEEFENFTLQKIGYIEVTPLKVM